jgi:hypothetical protein
MIEEKVNNFYTNELSLKKLEKRCDIKIENHRHNVLSLLILIGYLACFAILLFVKSRTPLLISAIIYFSYLIFLFFKYLIKGDFGKIFVIKNNDRIPLYEYKEERLREFLIEQQIISSKDQDYKALSVLIQLCEKKSQLNNYGISIGQSIIGILITSLCTILAKESYWNKRIIYSCLIITVFLLIELFRFHYYEKENSRIGSYKKLSEVLMRIIINNKKFNELILNTK